MAKIQPPSVNSNFIFWLSNKGKDYRGQRIDECVIRCPKGLYPLGWKCWSLVEARNLAKKHGCLKKDVRLVYSRFSVGYVVWNKENRVLLDNGTWVDTHL